MADREFQWMNSGTLSRPSLNGGKPDEYQLDWCSICLDMADFEIVSSHKFFDAPNLTCFTPAGEIWMGVSNAGKKDYRDQLLARVRPEDDPRVIRIRGKGTQIGTLINVLTLPHDGTADLDGARVFDTIDVEIRAEGKPVTGQLRVSEKGLKSVLWIDDARMDQIVSAMISRRVQPKLQIEFAAMLFRKDGLWEGFISGKPKPLIFIDEGEHIPAVLSSISFLDEAQSTAPSKQAESISAPVKDGMLRHAVWLLPVTVASLLFIFVM